MSANEPRIEQVLAALKAEGRSSPQDWHRFHLFLKGATQVGKPDPPAPFILAASGESDASKHRRLGDQLHWAKENGCLDEALRYLTDLPAEDWNSCPLAQWNQDSYLT